MVEHMEVFVEEELGLWYTEIVNVIAWLFFLCHRQSERRDEICLIDEIARTVDFGPVRAKIKMEDMFISTRMFLEEERLSTVGD